MELTITINMDNAAFEYDRKGEVRRVIDRILHNLPEGMDVPADTIARDSNGNKVAIAEIAE